MDDDDRRSDVLGSAKRHGVVAVLCIVLLGVPACGGSPAASLTSDGAPTLPSVTAPPPTSPPSKPALPSSAASPSTTLLKPGAGCPVSAATVTSITGTRVYGESSTSAGSCAFDSLAGGRGLLPSEIRVDIQIGSNDLPSLYAYFAPLTAKGVAGCRPFEVLRRPDLGPGAFETLCAATPTAGPSSADDFLPLKGHRALTVTVNRGVGVRDHSVAACAAEVAALLRRIRAAW